ncbi:unnamed protein product [marine sediment metagenome]|uniref:NIF system FeS cluster assembly NifU N-terminal domain-containing protein n=1 Tax=marine sediment metagenome TaxID=412755 RepID=X1ASY2_9ZZZZ
MRPEGLEAIKAHPFKLPSFPASKPPSLEPPGPFCIFVVNKSFWISVCGESNNGKAQIKIEPMAIGKTLDEAKQITKKSVAESLDGLPKEKMHCSNLGARVQKYASERWIKLMLGAVIVIVAAKYILGFLGI